MLHNSSLVAHSYSYHLPFLSHLGDFGWGIIWSLIVTLGSPNLDLGFSCFFRIAFRYTWPIRHHPRPTYSHHKPFRHTWPIWTFLVWLVWLAWLHGFWARLLFIGLFFILFYFFSFSFMIIIRFLLVFFFSLYYFP